MISENCRWLSRRPDVIYLFIPAIFLSLLVRLAGLARGGGGGGVWYAFGILSCRLSFILFSQTSFLFWQVFYWLHLRWLPLFIVNIHSLFHRHTNCVREYRLEALLGHLADLFLIWWVRNIRKNKQDKNSNYTW